MKNKQLTLFIITIWLGFTSLTILAQQNTQSSALISLDSRSPNGLTAQPDTTFGVFTEITPTDSLFVTPLEEDFWVITTAPADYDNDGDLDIAVLGYYVVYNLSVEYKLILLRNDGQAGTGQWDFSYTEVSLGDLSTGNSDMAWADADSDGDLDLAVGTDGETVIYRNDTGTLALSDTELPGYWEDNSQANFDLRSITWADFDNDGDPDLLLPSVFDFNTFSYRTALMRNDGPNGTGGWIFNETDSVFASTAHAQSAWADFDGDQDLDLLLVNVAPITEESFIRRYRNDGNGVFIGEDILGSVSVENGEAQWGDYDGDGDLDILVAGTVRESDGTFTHMTLRIYQNENENYVPFEVIADLPGEGWFDLTAATWADYDSDGDMDILLAGNYNSGTNIEGRARIYTNTNGVFADSGNELPAPLASGDRGGTFSWLDIDGEGDLDYFIAGQYFVLGGNGLVEAQMHLYRNDTPTQNNAPLSPTGLNVTQVSDSSALLSWISGTDDHTPSVALTYDLKLFRDDVPVTVPTRTPEPGNVSAVTEWLLTGLQTGNYKWTLSTVDAAYIGSEVVEGEFSIVAVAVNDNLENPIKGYTLIQNYPNPFSNITNISFSLVEERFVSIDIYDINGRYVRNLLSSTFQQGTTTIEWNGKDNKGRQLNSGIYVCRMTIGNESKSIRMIIQ